MLLPSPPWLSVTPLLADATADGEVKLLPATLLLLMAGAGTGWVVSVLLAVAGWASMGDVMVL